MSDKRKERERTELRRVIWNIANDLRGSVDGWAYTGRAGYLRTQQADRGNRRS